jgi:hypothetical protein
MACRLADELNGCDSRRCISVDLLMGAKANLAYVGYSRLVLMDMILRLNS